MAAVLSCLIIAHMLADFVFQSRKMAEKKRSSKPALLLHSGVYAACILAALFLCVKAESIWLPFAVIAGSHIIIDFLRARVLERKEPSPRKELFIFICDQLLHISLIVFSVLIFDLSSYIGSVLGSYISAYTYTTAKNVILTALIYIAVLSPSAVFVKEVLSGVFGGRDNGAETVKVTDGSGYLIGIFERLITVTLVLVGQFGALGFVLAAKSLARFKQLEDKDFAERYLVGTLLSVSIALCGTMAIKLFK